MLQDNIKHILYRDFHYVERTFQRYDHQGNGFITRRDFFKSPIYLHTYTHSHMHIYMHAYMHKWMHSERQSARASEHSERQSARARERKKVNLCSGLRVLSLISLSPVSVIFCTHTRSHNYLFSPYPHPHTPSFSLFSLFMLQPLFSSAISD